MSDAKQICLYPPVSASFGSGSLERSVRRRDHGYKKARSQLGTPIQTSLNGLL